MFLKLFFVAILAITVVLVWLLDPLTGGEFWRGVLIYMAIAILVPFLPVLLPGKGDLVHLTGWLPLVLLLPLFLALIYILLFGSEPQARSPSPVPDSSSMIPR